MYLKSIEVYGFKSFAHKTLFEFHNGITAIVGPNGSGKSNVSDAVRWVLGEQSAKQLRGASMQDVIFAGTENRKPLSYAYVALTMDNSDHVLPIDYEEVTIARRVYRSGESEYLLNGTPCRLKDVSELFYDTGIGKEGYSIIGQGQIERIISGKPEERRELFDEAVGIVKYKKRKDATTKKLQETRDNLVRINDILAEQEKLIGPLEHQSQKAKEYLRLKEEQKTLEVNLFLLVIDDLRDSLQKLKNDKSIAVAQMEETSKQDEEIKKQYEELGARIETLDQTIEKLREEESSTTVSKGKLENQILLLEEQIRSAKSAADTISERVASIEKEKEEKIKGKAEYDAKKSELSDVLDDAVKRLESVKANYDELQKGITECNTKMEEDNNALMSILEKRSSLKANESKLSTMADQINIRKATLNQRLLERKTKEEDLDKAINEAQADFSKSEAKLEELKIKDKELMNSYVEWKNKRKNVNEELLASRDEFARVSTKLESLKNIAERYEGYGNSVKSVLNEKDKGVIGPVSDLIHVDQKYEIAIETALGGNIQNIVTEDEACAKRMIGFLKNNKLGRATFLPLTSVNGEGNFKKRELLDEKGVLGLANELVECDSKYKNVVAYLLGRVMVCDNVDSALAIAKKNNYSLHMVTIDGEYLSPGGSISGGRFKNSSNLLGRNREIEELEKKLDEIQKTIDEKKNRLEEIDTAIALCEDDRQENADILSEVMIAVNTAKLNLDKANEQKADSLKAFEGLTSEEKDIESQLKDIAVSKSENADEIKKLDETEKNIKSELEELAKKVDENSYMQQSVSRNLSEIQLEESSARQSVDFVNENIARIQSEIDKCDEDVARIKADAESSVEETARKLKEIEEIKLTIMAADDNYKSLVEKIAAAAKEREEANLTYKSFFDERQKITDAIAALDKENYRLDTQIEKVSNNIDYQTNYMWNEYELTQHNCEELRDESLTDLPAIRNRVSGIKDSIKGMGNVNVGAIEEYKELSERYTLLKTQHDDIIESEASLVQIIEELDDGMRTAFNEGFKVIQEEFNKSFKELFGGGHGSLELVEDEDVLESGIRIIAQPPGKKLQNMMQMSGGEKSLTAIALLFAIQNMKPSPFCLLDEIEAALDDANVDRFSKYLNKLTKNTQFIIITHRRGTMNAADRLYGITMQEKGISALVSVNLIEADLDE